MQYLKQLFPQMSPLDNGLRLPNGLAVGNGIFNPLINHRQQRVLRRHLSLLDFLARAACSHARWVPAPDQRAQRRADALAAWY